MNDYFHAEAPSPYMLLTFPVAAGIRLPVEEEMRGLFGMDKLKVVRSSIPAVTHVDFSARIQSVNERTAPRYHKLIRAFEKRTGCGVIVNTSFNIRGEPIVCTPEEAYRCFMYTDMDALVLEDCLCLKADQPALPGAEEYRRKFKLD